LLIEFDTKWILNQLDEFKSLNGLKPQNLKQMINTINIVPCTKYKDNEDNTGNQQEFNSMQSKTLHGDLTPKRHPGHFVAYE
jgi:hypothetical protein